MSFVHSTIATILSYKVLRSNDFILNPSNVFKYNKGIGNLQSISLGYFLYDIIVDLKLKKWSYILHGICSFMAYYYSFTPFLMNFGPVFLLWESSTPFVNLNWWVSWLFKI